MVIASIPKLAGMIYALIAFPILLYLLYSNKYTKKIGYLFFILSILMGFLVFAPMFPYQFQMLIIGNTNQLGGPLPIVILSLVLFIILTLVFGRIFCGFICPIGTLQELAYQLPTKKLKIVNKTLVVVLHLLFFLFFVLLGVFFSIGILTYLGVRDFFYLAAGSVFFFVFLAFVLLSLVLYRPFCRFLCPYGLLLSLVSLTSVCKLRRTSRCTMCGKCENVCPTNEAGKTDLKQECYLCNRCRDVCPADALAYGRAWKK